jgi:hypothetical protein
MRLMASGKDGSRSRDSWTEDMRTRTQLPKFAICLKDTDAEDLVVRKIYQVLPDDDAAHEKYLRIVDESGEDYLYPARYFFVLELPQQVSRLLKRSTSPAAAR